MFSIFRVNGDIRAELWGGLPWFVVVQETSGAEFIGLMGSFGAGGDLRMDESILKDDNGKM